MFWDSLLGRRRKEENWGITRRGLLQPQEEKKKEE